MTRDEIRAIPLFSGVSDAALDLVVSSAGEIEAQPGQVLALPGDAGTGMCFVLDGTVAVELRHETLELGKGEFFGELAIFAPGVKRVGRVRAVGPTRCLALARDEAISLVETEPTLALALVRALAARLAGART